MPPIKRAVATVETESTEPADIVQELYEDYPVGSPEQTSKMVADLQASMAAQQAQISQLLAERGIPADPIAAQIQALQDHVHVQASANPNHKDTYAPVLSYVDKLTSDAVKANPNKALKAANLVGALRETVPSHELSYAHHLAKGLHTLVLDPDED